MITLSLIVCGYRAGCLHHALFPPFSRSSLMPFLSFFVYFVQDYLSLKCFLLERFMHDLLFESQNPQLINDFLGLE